MGLLINIEIDLNRLTLCYVCMRPWLTIQLRAAYLISFRENAPMKCLIRLCPEDELSLLRPRQDQPLQAPSVLDQPSPI